MDIFVLPASLAPHGFNALDWIIVLAGCLALVRVSSHLAHALQPAPFAPGPIAADLPLYALMRLRRRADPSAKVLP
jgi:APA family basic amino acid/polyamine antiporter